MKLVTALVVGGSVVAVSAPAANAQGLCGPLTPQYCPAPAVSTGPVIGVTDSSAVLTGTVNPNGAATNCAFTYAVTSPNGMPTPVQSIPAGSSPVLLMTPLVGLEAQTGFQYALECISDGGLGIGSTATFATLDHGPSHLSLTGDNDFVSSGRYVSIFLGCYGDESCRGEVTLRVYGQRIAAGRFSLGNNSGGPIELRVTKKTFRKLEHRSLNATIKATQTNGGNTVSHSITLHRFS